MMVNVIGLSGLVELALLEVHGSRIGIGKRVVGEGSLYEQRLEKTYFCGDALHRDIAERCGMMAKETD